MPYVRRKTTTRRYRRKRPTTTRKPRTTTRVPYRRKRRATGSRSVNGARKIMALNQVTVQRGYVPFGTKYYAKLPYAQDLYMATHATLENVARVHAFRINSLFDPDYTGVGHQPLYFDQLAAFYDKYRVNSIKVSVTFTDPTSDGLYVGISATHLPSGATNSASIEGKSLSEIRERRIATVYPLNNSGKQMKTVSAYIPCNTVLGLSKTQYQTDSGTLSGVGFNPGNVGYLEVFIIAPNNTNVSVTASVKLTYYATFFDYKPVAQS